MGEGDFLYSRLNCVMKKNKNSVCPGKLSKFLKTVDILENCVYNVCLFFQDMHSFSRYTLFSSTGCL